MNVQPQAVKHLVEGQGGFDKPYGLKATDIRSECLDSAVKLGVVVIGLSQIVTDNVHSQMCALSDGGLP